MSYKVKLNIFEGPFDLLVYLIESAKMSIYDIKISEITSQYIQYISSMSEMNVEVSSDFMVLASELVNIKSKMLLPRIKIDGEEDLEDDPRSQLVEKILEYKMFKSISEMLAEREESAINIHEKPKEDISIYTENPDEYLAMDIDKFVRAFNNFLRKKKKEVEIKERYEMIKREKASSEEKMEFIATLFKLDKNKTVSFESLIQNRDEKYDVALSFSSMLEMVKQKRINAKQKAIFGEILISATKELERQDTNEQ